MINIYQKVYFLVTEIHDYELQRSYIFLLNLLFKVFVSNQSRYWMVFNILSIFIVYYFVFKRF